MLVQALVLSQQQQQQQQQHLVWRCWRFYMHVSSG
jgi:hypothetical protein